MTPARAGAGCGGGNWAARTGKPLVGPGQWPKLGGALPDMRRGRIRNGYLQSPDEGSLNHES